jgi:hypothetical protein
MEFDPTTTAAAFVVLIAVGTGVLLAMPIGMATSTVLMMVLPSMVVFGLICLLLGVRYGEYRATAR